MPTSTTPSKPKPSLLQRLWNFLSGNEPESDQDRLARESYEYVKETVTARLADYRVFRVYDKMCFHYKEGPDDAKRVIFSLSAIMPPDLMGDFFEKWITAHNSDLDYLWKVHAFVAEGGKQSIDQSRREEIKRVHDFGKAMIDSDILFFRLNQYARQLAVDSLIKGPDVRQMYEYFPQSAVKSLFGGTIPNCNFDGFKD